MDAMRRCWVMLALCAGARLAMAADTPSVVKAMAEEHADGLRPSALYRPRPQDLKGEPGSLIRSETFSGYHLEGARATRFLYRSRSQDDHPTVASAVVIVPAGTPPAGGWPYLVWAHGTTGVARQCAPTLSAEVGYYTTVLAKEGQARKFAVVAIDYSGLGAGGRHEYLWKTSNAKDVVYAAPAARLAEPALAPAWVAIGHSQGGQAVWGAAELQATLHDPSYRGAVALAPAIDSEPLVNSAASTAGETFYPVYVAYGIKSVRPEFDVATMLLPTGLEAYQRLTTRGCWGLAHALFEPVKAGSVVREGWTHSPAVQKFLAENRIGDKAIAAPIFIGSGDVDTAVPARIVSDRTKALCGLGAQVQYKMYAGDHESMMRSSYEDQMRWITDRFAGRPAPKACP